MSFPVGEVISVSKLGRRAGDIVPSIPEGALYVGFFGWRDCPALFAGGLVDEPVRLTRDQAEALSWATSTEGQLARNLMKWNAGYLEGCEEQAQQLGVKLRWGASEAQSGFCVLWVQPPSKRSWVEPQ